ncbi:phosphate uptake regulator, PhoU [Desulfonatronum thiosulfatophilum]|uniref:Phosphate-specific transport system accessory protein PhoU n=1 Tax=Desulfonatronum thiosulfatophilum TaxID=617002 RepID=A0A1G6DJ58_9BACT|nr:phosphate signaling complex protein PhoU [Desulfonatronum thiosulfatophilum]SDB45129.1 phosphate uptake regulator, PhoU [Desulfonatronum thiosulfatophilum]
MSHLAKELDRLNMKVMQMVVQTEQAVSKTVTAFSRMDADLAQEVVDNDKKINELEVQVYEMCMRLLALEQPVARDLRLILGCMRMSVDLERIGDEAANIADAIIFLSLNPPLDVYDKILLMGQKSYDMLQESIIAFSSSDMDKAVTVCRMDFEVDELNSAVIKDTIQYMTRDSRDVQSIECGLQSINIARRLERVADMATNIAETTMFIVKGKTLKDSCQFDQTV